MSQVMEPSKKPCRSPSTTIFSRCASASAVWPRWTRGDAERVGASRIVQQCLHVFDGRGERERRNGGAVAIERQHVVTPRRSIAKNEDLAPPFSPQVDQF